MNDTCKLLWMFEQVHGWQGKSGSCYTEVVEDDDGNAVVVEVRKNGNLCWSDTKLDLVFKYLTKHLD